MTCERPISLMSVPTPMRGKGAGKGAPPPKSKPPGPGVAPLPPRGLGREGSGPQAYTGPKLRPLFWQAAAQVPEKSVWGEMGAPVPFDQAVLERRFALAETRLLLRKGTGTSSTSNLGSSAVETPRKRTRILDDRTSQMLAIAFSRLPPPERLESTIEQLADFPEGLPAEAIIALHAATIDHKEAVEQLRNLEVVESELSLLDLPERYLWVLGKRPLCAAKIACGAVIVGPARELPELKQACDQIMTCCQKLRRSDLILKCISTSLAVGNHINRGTPRFGANALVLPDALLKLEDLRGIADAEDGSSPADGTKGPSLLDFVAEALVQTAVAKSRDKQTQQQLRLEAEVLRDCLRNAAAVDLSEAEAHCRKLLQTTDTALQLLTACGSSSSSKLESLLQLVCEESKLVAQLVEKTKEELQFSQEWSSAKPGLKATDWIVSWGQFLDQFAQAIGRARPPVVPEPVEHRTAVKQRSVSSSPVTEKDTKLAARALMLNVKEELMRDCAKDAPAASHQNQVPPMPSVLSDRTKLSNNQQQVSSQQDKRKDGVKVQLDDDERIEVLLARMASEW